MVDLRRCPKTVTLLKERGLVLVEGKPKLAPSWHMACVPHLRGAKKEHKVRQEAVRNCAEQPDAMAFLGWVLLTDSWRHVRAEAVRALATLWEDRGAESDLVHEALSELVQRLPQPGMRQILPRLEQEARRFFILPAKRRRLREFIALLDQATAHLKDLPLTAMASVESTNLPVPAECPVPEELRAGLDWRQRLKRFFGS